VRRFKVDPLAQGELDHAAGWYEQEREGLGLEVIEEVDRVLARIETQEKFVPHRWQCSTMVLLGESSFCASRTSSSSLKRTRRAG